MSLRIEHKTEKGSVCFVKVPDDNYNFSVGISKLYFKVNQSSNHLKIKPSGNWQLIGLTSEVTEEQCKMMVDVCNDLEFNGIAYNDYESTSIHDTALDSFKSLMQHLQVYEVNHLAFDPTGVTTGEWQEAQFRTGRLIVLFKPND